MKPVVMRTLLSLAVATALAGCSLAPTYERPQAPVDAAYPSGPAYGAPGQAAAGAPAAADVGWRDFFGDPLLQELLALSLANNRDLRVAALNVEAARLNPSGQAGISRSYQVGASLSTWELDLFGRIRSLSEQALQLYLAQDETRLATQLTLVAETANAYLTLRADQELLALTRQTLAAQQESYKLTRQSYDLGVATELDLSQAEISLRTAERNLSQYTRMAAQDRNALVRWWASRCRPASARSWTRPWRCPTAWSWPTCRRACRRICSRAGRISARRSTSCKPPTPASARRARRSSRASA